MDVHNVLWHAACTLWQARSLLAAFEAAAPDHPSHASSRAMLAHQSAPMLHQRAVTLNGVVSRMRGGGVPAAVDSFATRAAAQDAATTAFVRALALAPANGEIWNDLGTSLFFAGELPEASLACPQPYPPTLPLPLHLTLTPLRR